MRKVETEKAPKAIGPYSQAMISGNLVFTSGQIALDPITSAVVGDNVKDQTVRALENLGSILEAAGSGFEKVVKTTCFLVDMADFAAFNAVYAEFFGEHKPARSCVAVHQLPLNARVEIEVTVVK